jgi:hypothetical protein
MLLLKQVLEKEELGVGNGDREAFIEEILHMLDLPDWQM